ncbi:putative bifunctional diguanylate cyclase/phosphodiesterase [Marinobacter zhejiangensis]|uniref:PAS domain S-box-containing protein/diguanylate cyclase (GGDEF) domain-containing protein n=1 Tax=Marinobacter zhejiangensis TaxID=488535 RepID=A0A1I4M7X5_9GAMM|nr:bifunctional diguanylate cyclase/phosphodiesterase [Marinobacter zhejiangensis]SFL99236.1 PAS domain S-box-containing protein/diguanylate cyclase (GGDEF) domain-containing protein [Marinobacter zhejiangensis]
MPSPANPPASAPPVANCLAPLASYTRNAVLVTNPQGQIQWVNNGFVERIGIPAEDIIGRDLQSLLQQSPNQPLSASRIDEGLSGGTGFDGEVMIYSQSGQPLWFNINCSPLKEAESGYDGFVAILNDITRLMLSRQQLRISASVFERSHDAIMITDQDNLIIDVNPAFSRITGYSKDEVIGRSPRVLSSDVHSRTFYKNMWNSIEETQFWRGEITNRRKNGELFTELLSITRVHIDGPAQRHHVAVFSDITELKNHAEQLNRVSYYDDLTGLPNLQLLLKRLNRDIARADSQNLTLVHIDLDEFRLINSHFGHSAGDHVLNEVGRRLNAAVRENDTVARLTGDEFLLLLPECRQGEIGQRLLTLLHEPIVVGPTSVRLNASLGIAHYPQDASDPHQLLRHAGQAMHLVKDSGGNAYHRFDPSMLRYREKRRERLRELHSAIARDEFVLHYQPQLNMATGEIIGAEALIRWQHPQQGLLSPAEFLPVVTGSDLEAPMGRWVVREAFRQCSQWHQAGLNLKVSVNISAHHLMTPDFPEFLAAELATHPGLSPQSITLEVLESTALDDTRRAGNVIEACRAMGFEIALDDFGTGYSSLAYFRSLPIDLIKIDKSFVRNLLDNDNDRAIVESVVFLAKRFNRPVLAEGVETAAHARLLKDIGCDYIQGYGVARPMAPGRFTQWLAQWHKNPQRQTRPLLWEPPCAPPSDFEGEEPSDTAVDPASAAAQDGTP